MFQLSKGFETLLVKARAALNLPLLTLISQSVACHVQGNFCESGNIYEAPGDIIFLSKADGTEEIPANARAVIVKHYLP